MTECLLNKKLVLIILSALELCLSENGAKLIKNNINKRVDIQAAISFYQFIDI